MSLTFPTTTQKKPSGLTALPNQVKRPAFGTLHGFDAQGGASAICTNDYYIDLSEVGDRISCGDPSWRTASEPANLTVSSWVNADAFANNRRFVQLGNSTTSGKTIGFGLAAHSGAVFRGFYRPTTTKSQEVVVKSSALSTGTWYHVCFTYASDGTAVLYIDGSADTTADSTYGYDSAFGCNDLEFGRKPCHNNWAHTFLGKLDEVAIWTSVLGASEVAEIAVKDGSNPGAPCLDSDHGDYSSSSDLVGWWRMGDGTENGSGDTIYDMSSNSNNGTIVDHDDDDSITIEEY